MTKSALSEMPLPASDSPVQKFPTRVLGGQPLQIRYESPTGPVEIHLRSLAAADFLEKVLSDLRNDRPPVPET